MFTDSVPNEKSLLERVEFYEKITKKYNLNSVYSTHYDHFHEMIVDKKDIRALWHDLLKNNTRPFLSLYIHIPFCKESRCRYCMYPSNILQNPAAINDYLNHLEEEINFFAPVFANNEFTTFYVGGGTPTILNVEQLARLFDMVFHNFKFKPGAGAKCIEVSPNTVTAEKIMLARGKGINRVSLGIQSLDEKVMETANRKFFSYETVKNLIEFIKKQRFEDFNVDLMAWLPDDSIRTFIRGMEKIMRLNVPSITVYFYRHSSYRFQNASPLKDHEKYTHYKVPYDRYELLNHIDSLRKEHSYYSLYNNPHNEFQCLLKIGHTPPLQHPTESFLPLRNSILGLGTHAYSFIEQRVRYRNTHTDIHNLDFTHNTYVTMTYPLSYQMRSYVLRNFFYNLKISSQKFEGIFQKNIFDVFKNEIDVLMKLKKLRIRKDDLILLTKDDFELNVCLKFFYNQETLLSQVLFLDTYHTQQG